MATYSSDIRTPMFRLRFSNLAKPDKTGNRSITMLFEKSADLDALKAAFKDVCAKEFGANFRPKNNPFKDGDEKLSQKTGQPYVGCGGKITVKASTKEPVNVLDATKGKKNGAFPRVPEAEADVELYEGCWCIAVVVAGTYNFTGENGMPAKGAKFFLRHILKMKDDERLGGGGGISADEAFADVELDSENPDNYPAAEGDGWDL